MELWRDIRFALRSFRRSPGFAVAAIAALAIAIGANTAVFTVVKALLTIALPIEEPETAAFLFSENPEQGVTQGPLSADDYLDLRAALEGSFEALSATTIRSYNLVGGSDPVRIQGAQATPEFFAVSRQNMSLGRGFLPEEGEAGRDRVVVLGYNLWQQRFGGKSDVLGQTVLLDGERYEIVGVAEDGFFFPTPITALWTPLALEAGATPRDLRTLIGFGRLAEGVSSREAMAQAATAAATLAAEYPDTNSGWTSSVMTAPENLRQGSGFAAVLLYVSITLVLLIACANVANLLLARSMARERELALRASLGAGRGRLVRQLLIESITLAVTAGVLGTALAVVAIDAIRNSLAPDPNVGFIANFIQLDSFVLLHSLAISAIAGVLFGVLPALQITRGDLGLTLKEGERGGSGGPKRRFLRSALVAAEVAFAMALLIGAGALLRTFSGIYAADPGFEPDGLLTFDLAVEGDRYQSPDQQRQFFERVVGEVSQLPGVDSAAATTNLPLTSFPGAGSVRVEADGNTTDDSDRTPNALDVVVTPGYFETMEIGLTRGRALLPSDRSETERVAVVTESMVDRLWPDRDPLGQRLRLERPAAGQVAFTAPATTTSFGDGQIWVTVVGVVENVESQAHSLRTPAKLPQVFLPLAQTPRAFLNFVVRTARADGDPRQHADEIRQTLGRLDETLPVDNLRTMNQAIAEVDTQNTFFLRVLSSLAMIALILSAVGIYSVIAYSVAQRTREIGIRSALGARPLETVLLVARQAAWLTGIGLVIGNVFGFLLVRFLGSQLQGIAQTRADGAATFVAVAAFFLAVAVLASLVPAGRAIRIDPVVALRDD